MVALYHVLPSVNSVPQKKLHIGDELVRPNFYRDFKWCMWHKSNIPEQDVFFFSPTKKVCGPVWRVQDYRCVETTLALKKEPTIFNKRTNFECTIT